MIFLLCNQSCNHAERVLRWRVIPSADVSANKKNLTDMTPLLSHIFPLESNERIYATPSMQIRVERCG